jgi:alpha-galactosidase
VGRIALFAHDLDIPARYGILQTVGDTTGPGGISRALRAVPIFCDYARQIMVHCPEAWIINYTNPMMLCTAALYAAAPGIKA